MEWIVYTPSFSISFFGIEYVNLYIVSIYKVRQKNTKNNPRMSWNDSIFFFGGPSFWRVDAEFAPLNFVSVEVTSLRYLIFFTVTLCYLSVSPKSPVVSGDHFTPLISGWVITPVTHWFSAIYRGPMSLHENYDRLGGQNLVCRMYNIDDSDMQRFANNICIYKTKPCTLRIIETSNGRVNGPVLRRGWVLKIVQFWGVRILRLYK